MRRKKNGEVTARAAGRSDADDPFRSERDSEGRWNCLFLNGLLGSKNFVTEGRSGREARSEEIIERICNQSGHCERQKDVLWNQECRKMFHSASGRVYLREVYLRKPRGSDTFQADVKSKKPNLPESKQPEDPIIG
jgi:hypothetical protein